MKLGTETGSLINHVLTSGGQRQPQVGDGATICGWTDRHAATIVKVTPTQIHVQQDFAKRVLQPGEHAMSESQTYEYTPNPNASIIVFRKTKRGYHSSQGTGLIVGNRDEYYDYNF